MILIVSYMNDWHSKAVAWSLRNCGVECEEIDSYYLPSSTRMTLNLSPMQNPGFNSRPEISGQLQLDLLLSDVKVAWMRRLNETDFDYAKVHKLDRDVVRRECGAFFRNLYATIQKFGCVCINDENLSKRIDNKAVQLIFANEVGLITPATIISNDPTEIAHFAEQHSGKVIMKPFFQELWEEESCRAHQLASIVSLEQIQANEKSIRLCPNIYQELVPKAYELRIVVMGDVIYPIRIDSQVSEKTKIDWRTDSRSCVLSLVTDLPQIIRDKILRFMKACGIEFGSLDVIVTPDGKYVFLEINEQGQFLWLEQNNPDIRMLQAMTDYLGRRAGLNLDVAEVRLDTYLRSEQYSKDNEAYVMAKDAYLRNNA